MAFFLVVEVVGSASPVVELSRRLPGIVLDAFLQNPLPGEEQVARSICQVSGGGAADRGLFIAALRKADAGLLVMEAPAGMLRVSLGFPVATMARETLALAHFVAQRGLRVVWARLEEGVTFLRILVVGPEPADELAAKLHRFLVDRAIDGVVAVEAEAAERTVGRMREMERALQGLHRAGPQGF
jgi:hypothetical protein